MLLTLKYALNSFSMVQTLEYIFILSTFTLVAILILVQFYRKDFILGITHKDAAINIGNWLALFIFIDILTLKALPLATKCTLMVVTLSEKGKIDRARLSTFALKIILGLCVLTIDFFNQGLNKSDSKTIALYIGAIIIVILNSMYVYQYKVKRLINTYVNRETEMLKVRWVTHMFLAFYTPIFVFVCNRTPNYNILRFNYDLILIILLGVALTVHFSYSVLRFPSKIDINKTNLAKERPGATIIAVCLFAYLLSSKVQECWIVTN